MKKIFVCSPYRGDTTNNIKNAIEYSRDVIDLGHLPITPHLYITQILDDTIPLERARGLLLSLELLSMCDELWFYGNPTEGMEKEIVFANNNGIPIKRQL